MISRKTLVFLVVILGFLAHFSQSLRFDLESGHTKCISEDMTINALSVGQYHVVNPNAVIPSPDETQRKPRIPLPDTHKVTVRVTSAYGTNYHRGENVEAGHFSFTAGETGDYMACFWVPEHKPAVTVTVDLVWRTGVTAKDWGDVAKKGSIDAMELELKKLMDTVSGIHDEMFYLRDREDEMQTLNKTTNSRMFWLSLLSLIVCLSVAALQVWHLKSFFERKKLL